MQLVSLAINPVPAPATVGALEGYDGTKLRYAHWPATRGPLLGTVCIFPGRGEYIEKYFEVVADLRRRGFAVSARLSRFSQRVGLFPTFSRSGSCHNRTARPNGAKTVK